MEPHRKAIELLTQECGALEDRYEGYKTDAASYLTAIVKEERDAQATGSNALKKVQDVLTAFGDKLNRQQAQATVEDQENEA